MDLDLANKNRGNRDFARKKYGVNQCKWGLKHVEIVEGWILSFKRGSVLSTKIEDTLVFTKTPTSYDCLGIPFYLMISYNRSHMYIYIHGGHSKTFPLKFSKRVC